MCAHKLLMTDIIQEFRFAVTYEREHGRRIKFYTQD